MGGITGGVVGVQWRIQLGGGGLWGLKFPPAGLYDVCSYILEAWERLLTK